MLLGFSQLLLRCNAGIHITHTFTQTTVGLLPCTVDSSLHTMFFGKKAIKVTAAVKICVVSSRMRNFKSTLLWLHLFLDLLTPS